MKVFFQNYFEFFSAYFLRIFYFLPLLFCKTAYAKEPTKINYSNLDMVIFIVIISLFIFAVVVAEKRKRKQDEKKNFLDYLLLGRQLSLPLFVTTLVATWYGGIFGVTEIAYSSGIYNLVTQGVFWYLTYIIFAIFLVKKVKAFEAVSLPELVEKIVGPKSSYLAAVFNLINVIPVSYVIGIGLLLSSLFPISFFLGCCIGGFSVATYASIGGFRSVVYSDVVQFFFMCLAVALVLFFSIRNFGGLQYLQSNLPASYFTITGQHSWLETLSWGFIALATLVDPNFYQRVFAANSAKTARLGILISTLIWLVFDICTTFGAMYAKATMPNLASDTAYLHYALYILPDGFRGVFLAGIAATILSTLDSYLFIASNTLNYDLFRWRKWNSKVRLSYWLSAFLVTAFSIMLAMFFDGNIKLVWKTLGGISASCLLLPLLLNYTKWFRFNDLSFIGCSLSGATAIVLAKIFSWSLDPFYVGSLGCLLGYLVAAGIKTISARNTKSTK